MSVPIVLLALCSRFKARRSATTALPARSVIHPHRRCAFSASLASSSRTMGPQAVVTAPQGQTPLCLGRLRATCVCLVALPASVVCKSACCARLGALQTNRVFFRALSVLLAVPRHRRAAVVVICAQWARLRMCPVGLLARSVSRASLRRATAQLIARRAQAAFSSPFRVLQAATLAPPARSRRAVATRALTARQVASAMHLVHRAALTVYPVSSSLSLHGVHAICVQ